MDELHRGGLDDHVKFRMLEACDNVDVPKWKYRGVRQPTADQMKPHKRRFRTLRELDDQYLLRLRYVIIYGDDRTRSIDPGFWRQIQALSRVCGHGSLSAANCHSFW